MRIRLKVSTDGTASLGPGRNRIISVRFDQFTEFMRTNMLDYGHAELAGATDLGLRTLITRVEEAADKRGQTARSYLELTAVVTEAWTGKQYVVYSPKYDVQDLQDRFFRTDTSAARRRAAKLRKRGSGIREWLVERERRPAAQERLAPASGNSGRCHLASRQKASS